VGDKHGEATYQDVLDAPEHKVAEIIDGELILSPRPGGPAASVVAMLCGELIPPFCHGRGGPGGWILLREPELHFGKTVIVPDFAGWRITRMPHVPDEAYITLAPDWVCEVASKSTEKLDRKRKLPIYASVGVGHAWLIQPRIRSLEVLRLFDGRWSVLDFHTDADKVRAEPFEQLELELASLWWGLPMQASESIEYGELEY
jgi:Uma2 family endonuclease